MIKDIYEIGSDFLDRIEKASQAKITKEIAYAMLASEIEDNLLILKSIIKIKNEEKVWNCFSMLSTDALALVIFNEKNRVSVAKDFKNIYVAYGDKEKCFSGIDSTFMVYKKISNLKKIALLSKDFIELKKTFRVQVRIKNIICHYEAISKVIYSKK
jgi:hypothetical protein